MSNPARELLSIFTAWKENSTGNVQPQITRGWAGRDDPTQTYFQAMRCLLGIQRAIEDLKTERSDVDYFDDYLTSWLKIVLNYPSSWQTGITADGAFPVQLLDQLQGLQSSWISAASRP